MAVYMKNRRKQRREKLISILGDKCVNCESLDNLQLDHKDRSNKSFGLSGYSLDKPWEFLLEELKKCQLLCKDCHSKKTLRELGGPVQHGSFNMYTRHKCRCDSCRKNWNERCKQWKLNKQLA